MEFLSNSQNVKSLRKLKVPLLKTFWRWLFGLNLTSFRATISLRSGKMTYTRIVNLTVATVWVHFTWRVLLV